MSCWEILEVTEDGDRRGIVLRVSVGSGQRAGRYVREDQ